MNVVEIALLFMCAIALHSRFSPQGLISPISAGGMVRGGGQDVFKMVANGIIQIIALSLFAKWLSRNSASTGKAALGRAKSPVQYMPDLSESMAASRFTGRTLAVRPGIRP